MEYWKRLTAAQKQEAERQLGIFRRGAVEIIPEAGLKEKLAYSVLAGKPLRIKLGLDPSAPDIHIGHTVVLHKLRQFQDLGHEIQLIIGDFTGRIGDPTGKSETRKQLSDEDVKRNARTYERQLYKVLDPKRTTFFFNSAWLSRLNMEDALQLAAKVTLARMLERNDFSNRYDMQQAIHLHEFFYPLMQGYDSVELRTDIELGGTDQTFNILMGRTLQSAYQMEHAQTAIFMPLLEGLDGQQKMSKSLGNYIGIDDAPNEMFGKTMSISDELMLKYYELTTDCSLDELLRIRTGLEKGELHPRDIKMNLAKYYVSVYHGDQAAAEAEQHFITVFRKNTIPETMEEAEISAEELEEGQIPIVKLLVKLRLVSSNGEARRSISQGAVRINNVRMTDIHELVMVRSEDVVQLGKRKFVKIVVEHS